MICVQLGISLSVPLGVCSSSSLRQEFAISWAVSFKKTKTKKLTFYCIFTLYFATTYNVWVWNNKWGMYLVVRLAGYPENRWLHVVDAKMNECILYNKCQQVWYQPAKNLVLFKVLLFFKISIFLNVFTCQYLFSLILVESIFQNRTYPFLRNLRERILDMMWQIRASACAHYM